MEEESNIIQLKDEEGNDVNLELLDVVELDDEQYIVLLPADEQSEEEPGEVVILKVENPDSEDEVTYIGIEDEDTLNKVFQIFKDKFSDEFDFVD